MFTAKVIWKIKREGLVWSIFFLSLGCYQDKLHPHERNRKQLETKFNKQPGGGASAAPAAAPEPAADEE